MSPVPILVVEPQQAERALSQAVRWREAGTRYFASVYLPDPYLAGLEAAYTAALATRPQRDQWRFILHETPDRKAAAAKGTFDLAERARGALLDVVALADGLAVRSFAELGRIEREIGAIRRTPFRLLAPEPLVPAPPADTSRRRIVVWAPFTPATGLLQYVSVLAELGIEATVVCGRGRLDAGNVEFTGIGGARQALAQARAIVDATLGDPASAVGLAAYGVPVCVPIGNGAEEFLGDAIAFDPAGRESLNVAVGDALGARPPRIYAVAAPEPPVPGETPAHMPLVSVVVATYNRRLELAQALGSIERQTYPNLEIIVVDDAGEPVGDIVAGHPRARLIVNPRNLGPFGASNVGLRQAQGEWITWLDDDDRWFPDHLERMVATGQRSGEAVVAGQTLFRVTRVDAEGKEEVLAYVRPSIAVHDRSLLHAQCTLLSPAVLLHRRAIERVGLFDADLIRANDYEYYLRLGEAFAFARCDVVTTLYTATTDGRNRSDARQEEFVTGHKAIYARYPSDDAYVRMARKSILEILQKGSRGTVMVPLAEPTKR